MSVSARNGGWSHEVARDLEVTRRRTLELVGPLSEERLCRQVRSFLSPLCWDLGHIANFEELWLVRAVGVGGMRPDRDGIYNALETPRHVRGTLEIPSVAEALDYLAEVREQSLEILKHVASGNDELPRPADPAAARFDRLLANGFVYRMVNQHEGQHQETMLQALDMPEDDWEYPLGEAVTSEETGADGAASIVVDDSGSEPDGERKPAPVVDDAERIEIPAGEFELGTMDRSRAYDNERPRHRRELAGYAIDRFPTTVRRWLEFMADEGYTRPELWSEGGRAWLTEADCRHPQGWFEDRSGRWRALRLGHEVRLDPVAPVQHICYWEAEAFARWCGGRLPTEPEWEKAASWDPEAGRTRPWPWGDVPPDRPRANVGLAPAGDPRRWGPRAVGSYPLGASAYGVEQLIGEVYEWTSSPFAGYPGFEAFPYREYSEVFFGDRYRALRGASWASHPAYARATYRNWDLPQRRQLFAGVRVAWDLG